MRGRTLRSLLVALAITTLGVCAVATAGAVSGTTATGTPLLVATPSSVQPGASLRLRGSGFPADAHLTLFAKSAHGQTMQIGSAVTGRRGSFVATIRIRLRSTPGAFLARACHDACRLKASARFRIVKR